MRNSISSKARRTQINNSWPYLAEPYSNKDQVAMNNAEPLCLATQLFSIISISTLMHMGETNRLCHKWLNYCVFGWGVDLDICPQV